MKTVIQTWGSNGDVRPAIALAGGLQDAGHDTTLIATSVDNRDYSKLCGELGVKSIMIPKTPNLDIRKFIEKSSINGIPTHNINFIKLLMKNLFYPYQDAMLKAACEACRGSDVAIGHFLCYPLRFAAAKNNIPYVSLTYWPGLIPTAHGLQPGMPSLGKPLNSIAWKTVRIVLNMILKKDITAFCDKHKLPRFKDTLRDAFLSDTLNLIAASPVLCDSMPDWGKTNQLCGFFNVPDMAENWQEPEYLKNFLKEGEAPVFMGLGSMQVVNPEKCADILTQAARIAGCRAIIQSNSQKFPPGSVDNNICYIDSAPHHRLFPQCAAVVHHGGAGTTHTAARSGCPAITVPFLEEQHSWGKILYKKELGARPLPFTKATSKKLAQRIRYVLDSTRIKENAIKQGKIIKSEDGIKNAIKLIEKI